ncbi:hypothetical protein BC833DRAFT_595369, partial [Globomyces pollinis-pini]
MINFSLSQNNDIVKTLFTIQIVYFCTYLVSSTYIPINTINTLIVVLTISYTASYPVGIC